MPRRGWWWQRPIGLAFQTQTDLDKLDVTLEVLELTEAQVSKPCAGVSMPIEATFYHDSRRTAVVTAPPHELLGAALTHELSHLPDLDRECGAVGDILAGQHQGHTFAGTQFQWEVEKSGATIRQLDSAQPACAVATADFLDLLTRWQTYLLDVHTREWQTSADPTLLLTRLGALGGLRKPRLFACACARRVERWLTNRDSQRMLDFAEAFAEGTLSQDLLESARRRAEKALLVPMTQRGSVDWHRLMQPANRPPPLLESLRQQVAAQLAAMLGLVQPRDLPRDAVTLPRGCWTAEPAVAEALARVANLFLNPPSAEELLAHHAAAYVPLHAYFVGIDKGGTEALAAWVRERGRTANVVRDLYGNPFCPPTVADDVLRWRDGTVPRIAAAIYEGKRFDELPILGDALEEAGCTHGDILDHCRTPSEHTRGCWVLDLLQGKK